LRDDRCPWLNLDVIKTFSFFKLGQWSNQDLNLTKQKYEILTGHIRMVAKNFIFKLFQHYWDLEIC
jgi:hypothetical protein